MASVLFLSFDDEEKPHQLAMTKEDATKVADFVNKYKSVVDCMVVHCEAGRSRSAGVAAAIMKYLNGDDMSIFNNGKYVPNMTCYRYTLEALFNTKADETELKQKEDINTKKWREENDI